MEIGCLPAQTANRSIVHAVMKCFRITQLLNHRYQPATCVPTATLFTSGMSISSQLGQNMKRITYNNSGRKEIGQEVGQISEETYIAVENEHRLGPDSLAL